MRCGPLLILAAGAAAAAAPPELPDQVHLNGMLGSKAALLLIDGEPRTVEVGATVKGVRLVALDDGRAIIDVGGRRQTLALGAQPGRVTSDARRPEPPRLVLPIGPGGHFTTIGTINGQVSSFLVDTGATSVSISQVDAERLGLRYLYGKRIVTQTANGIVPAYVIELTSLRIGELELRHIEAIVVPGPMSHVLLGNNFLNRFVMRRDGDQMTLELRR